MPPTKASSTRGRFAAVRLIAQDKMPYMNHYIMSLVPVERPGLGTFATDKWMRLYYDPEYFNSISDEDAAWALIHEALHGLLKYFARADIYLGKNATAMQLHVFNMAQDIVINEMIIDAIKSIPNCTYSLPSTWLTAAKFKVARKLATEQYYELLWKNVETITIKVGCAPGEGACGSCADNREHDWEEDAPASEGGDSEVTGVSEYEQKVIDRLTLKKIDEHERQHRGTVPSNLVRYAKEILQPKVDPTKELLSEVRYAVNSTNGYGDYTYRKLPRRMPPGALRLQAHIRPLPRVVVLADTSGSMGDRDCGLALGLVGMVVMALPHDGVLVYAGDTTIAAATKVFRPEQVVLAGCGGTSMRAIINEILDKPQTPDVIIVCTDGETDWPKRKEGGNTKIDACLTRKTSYCGKPPKFIRAVYLDGEPGSEQEEGDD